MDTFIGSKILRAEPMYRGQFDFEKGRPVELNAESKEAGYKVVYEDGYESWSPKPQFDAAYVKIPNAEGKPGWLLRLLGEEAQLLDRISKLKAFLRAEGVKRIADDEHRDLMEQPNVMKDYASILARRIQRHTKV